MSSMTPHERLTAAYAATDPNRQRRRDLAATFVVDPMFERLAREPELLVKMSLETRLAFGSYMAAREAYHAEKEEA